MATPAQIRRAYANAPHHDHVMVKNDGPLIKFRHPAYHRNENLLLALPAYDTDPGGNGGLHHETARIACAVIANCKWDGYLSKTANGPRINIDAESILTGSEYYFCVDGETDYPVVPTFSNFQFSHGNLPPSWMSPSLTIPQPTRLRAAANYTAAVTERDVSCRVTESLLSMEVAHLVPVAEEEWFRENSMADYAAEPDVNTTCDRRNLMLLRSDVHNLFDAKHMTIVPKAGAWVLHVVRPDMSALVDAYHNVPLQPLSQIGIEFIFARFVWTVLSLSPFPTLGKKRRFVLVKETEATVQEVKGAKLRTMFPLKGRSGSRSTGKRKRPRAAGDNGEEEESSPHDGLGDDDDGGEGHCLCNTSSVDEPPRGRPRKRLFDRPSDDLESDEMSSTSDEIRD